MQFGQIEAFVEIARQGSISRAAEILCLTQPTVTQRLRTLEEELGDKLFTRVKYGVALTEAGKVLLPYAERVLQTLSDATAALQNMREGTQGNLVVGSAPFISTYLLPTLLERFTREYPGVHVQIRTGHSEEVLDMVLRDEVPIGLVRKMKHPDIESVILHYDELILVAHPSHPFSQRVSVTIEEVAGEGVVLFDRTTSYHKLVNAIFVNAGVALKVSFEMDNVEAAKKIVEKGLGIALLPYVAIERELALGAMKSIQIAESPRLRRELVGIYRKGSGLGGIAHAFLRLIEDFSSSFPVSP